MIAENNYDYEEQVSTMLNGWYRAHITNFTTPKETKSGNATGFQIWLEVWDGYRTLKKSVWLSFDHPDEFVTRKSKNIGAMLRMMFPEVTNDAGYYNRTFWLLFETYRDKKTDELKEQFFNSKHGASKDGKTTLYGNAIVEEQSKPVEATKPPQDYYDAGADGSDVPF